MSNEINEKIFKSVDTIVSARLQDLEFDKTIVCIVEGTPESVEGVQKYIVNYKGASITAFVNDKDKAYNIDDEVYVLVPQGDFTQKKIITGQVISEFIEAKNDLSQKFIKVHTIVNQSLAEDVVLLIKETKSYANGGYLFLQNVPRYNGYTYIKVKLGFRADLIDRYTSKQVVTGDYGIEVILTYDEQKGEQLSTKTETYTWTQDDMVLLNKYQTGGYTNQEFYIDIKDKIISKVQLNFYQNGQFSYSDSTAVSFKDDMAVRIRDYSLEIGYKKIDLLNDKNSDEEYGLYLYTPSPLIYTSTDINRKIAFRVINMTSGLDATTQLGSYVKRLGLLDTSSTTNDGVLGSGWRVAWSQTTKESIFDLMLDSGIQNKDLTYLGGVIINDSIYVSNILVFTNNSYVANSNLLAQLTGLRATPQNNSNIFYVYGQDNQLINASDGEKAHKIALTFSSGDTSKSTALSAGSVITYTIPKYNTMLLPADTIVDSYQTDNSVYTFKKILASNDIDNGMYFIPFKIAPLYSPQYKNNTINITANIKNSGIFTTSQEFLFGNSGSSGANYILRPYLADQTDTEVRVLNPLQTGTRQYHINIELYNYSWEKITDFSELEELTYNWVHSMSAFQLNDKGYISGSSAEESQLARLVAEVSCKYKGNLLKGYLAIPSLLNSNNDSVKNYVCIDGCSVITYDITGKKPFYAKQAYTLYYKDTSGDTIEEINNVNWTLWNAGSGARGTEKLLNLANGIITPPAVYSSQEGYPYVVASVNSNDVWIQPIYMIENSYPVAMWNDLGSDITFEDKGKLLSTMVGQLDSSKQNGVIMGTFESNNTKEFGLYAFDGGSAIFEINNQGIAHINQAHALSKSDLSLYNSNSQPVYFKDGIPVAFDNNYFATAATVSGLTSRINSLESKISNLESTINNLKTRITALESN